MLLRPCRNMAWSSHSSTRIMEAMVAHPHPLQVADARQGAPQMASEPQGGRARGSLPAQLPGAWLKLVGTIPPHMAGAPQPGSGARQLPRGGSMGPTVPRTQRRVPTYRRAHGAPKRAPDREGAEAGSG